MKSEQKSADILGGNRELPVYNFVANVVEYALGFYNRFVNGRQNDKIMVMNFIISMFKQIF